MDKFYYHPDYLYHYFNIKPLDAKIQRKFTIQKDQQLSIIISIYTILTITIERPSWLLEYTLEGRDISWSDIYDPKQNISRITIGTHIVNSIFNHLVIDTLPWLLMLKYWLIYYNVEWTIYTQNMEWIIHLDHCSAAVHRNWYFRNKHKYGNFAYCIKRLCMFIAIVFIFNLIQPIIMAGKQLYYVDLVMMIIPIFPGIVMLVLYIKMYCIKFEDNFYIMREIKHITISYFGGIIGFILADQFHRFGAIEHTKLLYCIYRLY